LITTNNFLIQSIWFDLHLVFSITRSFSSVTVLEGDVVTLSCTPSVMECVLVWIHNGTDIKQRNDITYSPPMLNHSLKISNARLGDSGVYTCRSCHAANTLIEKNITVEVIEGKYISNKQCVFSFKNHAKLNSKTRSRETLGQELQAHTYDNMCMVTTVSHLHIATVYNIRLTFS